MMISFREKTPLIFWTHGCLVLEEEEQSVAIDFRHSSNFVFRGSSTKVLCQSKIAIICTHPPENLRMRNSRNELIFFNNNKYTNGLISNTSLDISKVNLHLCESNIVQVNTYYPEARFFTRAVNFVFKMLILNTNNR